VTSEATLDDRFSVSDLAGRMVPWSPDEWFAWPPDLFALTSMILKATGIYRLVVSPPHPHVPLNLFAISTERSQGDDAPLRTPAKAADTAAAAASEAESRDWSDRDWGEQDIREWFEWIRNKRDALPPKLKLLQEILFDPAARLNCDGEPMDHTLFRAILTLHALADQACRGFGMVARPEPRELSFLANLHLAVTGTLSRLPKLYGVVLPKCRTPQTGLSLRSLSHHLSFHHSEVSVQWRSIPWINRDDHENTINILAFPFPYEVSPKAFVGRPNPDGAGDAAHFRYFQYGPPPEAGLKVDEVIALLSQAFDEVKHVHVLAFPELALTQGDLDRLKDALVEHFPARIPLIVAGVRGKQSALPVEAAADAAPPPEGASEVNQVVLSAFFANKWYDLGQAKHHRWKLTAEQIRQYALAGTLSVREEWWEDIEIQHRRLTFLAPNGWLSLAPLICEDLAQLEPVSGLIRGVGPTLVLATLMDGPQLKDRWPARYVGVLADDPGTSILTLTSLGMARRCQPRGYEVDSTAVLWKDQERGAYPVKCQEKTRAVLLTMTAEWKEEFTADGRTDRGAAARFVLQSVRLLDERQGEGRPAAPVPGAGPDPNGAGGDPAGGGGSPRTEVDVALQGDLVEITALCYLVDAALDAGPDALRRLRSWARVDERPVDQAEFRPFPRLWQRLSTVWRQRGESKDRGDEYLHSVERVMEFLDRVNADVREGDDDRLSAPQRYARRLTRWENLVSRARAQFAEEAKRPDDREADLAYLSILWGIHNRIVRLRRQMGKNFEIPDQLHRQTRELLRVIERLFDDYDRETAPRAAHTGAARRKRTAAGMEPADEPVA
jgi:hypothetical protein